MDKITLHDKTFRRFIPNEEIEKAIDSVAERLNKDYATCTDEAPAIFLCTLNGAVIFAAELLKRLTFPLVLKACKLSSYEGVDTGNTIVAMTEQLKEKKAEDIRVCTLLLKKEVYKKDVKLDYVAMEIPNRFIVGFGLDYDELGRNIKDIYVLDD